MKRLSLYAGLGASLALCMLVACSNKASDQSSVQKKANQEVTEKKTEEEQPQSEPEPIPPSAAANEGEGACQSDSDCRLIPSEGCYGCGGEGGSHKAVNVATQMAFVKKNMQSCMAQFQKKAPRKEASNDPSCQFDGAGCVNGVCELKKLTEAEKQAEMQRMKEAQQQQGQQGQGPAMGQGQGQPQ